MSRNNLNGRKSLQPDESIDVEKLRSDLVSMCDELLKNLNEYSEVDRIKIIMQYTGLNNKKTFEKLLKLHNELVEWTEKEKSLMIKARSIDELGTIFCDVFNGFRKIDTQLNKLLRQSLEDARNNFRNTTSKTKYL
jgi:hypothetical protein